MENMDPAEGMYNSDYRGPQTHTYVPPSHKVHHRQHVVLLPRKLGNSAHARAHHHVSILCLYEALQSNVSCILAGELMHSVCR